MILTKENGFLSYHTPDKWIVCYTGKRPPKEKLRTKAQQHAEFIRAKRSKVVRTLLRDWRLNRLDWNLHGGWQ